LDTFKSFDLKIYQSNAQQFDDIALQIFRVQAENNPVYRAYIRNLRIDPSQVTRLEEIPYLPISFFKRHSISTGSWVPQTIFTSSGTTGMITSSHAVKSVQAYHEHARKCFEFFLGDLKDYHFLALLPSYLERPGSSLISMMQYFIQKSDSAASAFYLHNQEQLLMDVRKLKNSAKKTIVWGVAFALLDLVEKFQPDFSHCIVFETGGMKGRRKEITRMELHDTLCRGLGVNKIYSEYGMTELFSQAYTSGDERFRTPPWMKVMGREITDPFNKGLLGETSGINVIDLANWSTISFIETEDLGKVYRDGSFEILGRMDNSDVRGCNLLIE
jgi:phenylacetate-coenzyme A ligase PaaK-like adenylate-forming protein